jgi:hypothetical protein
MPPSSASLPIILVGLFVLLLLCCLTSLFWILASYQMYGLQIFSSNVSIVSAFSF